VRYLIVATAATAMGLALASNLAAAENAVQLPSTAAAAISSGSMLQDVGGTVQSVAPHQAQAAGYGINTFSTPSNFSPTKVDTGLTYRPGYQWYLLNAFGAQPSFATSSFGSDGSVTVGSMAHSLNGTLTSAAKVPLAPFFVGRAFGGGGYFEAEVSFDPDAVDVKNGWPSWWMMPVEHLAEFPSQQWPGQPAGYNHFVEVDAFEYNRGPAQPRAYGATLHDWYGLFAKTCPRNYCRIDSSFGPSTKFVPPSTDWMNTFHRVGVLWIPATSARKGSFTFYFDGVAQGAPVSYTQFSGQAPPPSNKTPWAFGAVDAEHLALIIGTGRSAPIHVRSVNVWQSSTKDDLVN